MRPHHPWYWAAKNAWFVEIGDTRHRLGQHPEDVPPPKNASAAIRRRSHPRRSTRRITGSWPPTRPACRRLPT